MQMSIKSNYPINRANESSTAAIFSVIPLNSTSTGEAPLATAEGGGIMVGEAANKRKTVGEWCSKYFCQGQQLSPATNETPIEEKEWLKKHRKYIALAIPFCIGHFLWWSTAISHNLFSLYPTHWQMPLTMVLGATVAGATSEGGGGGGGGGAVAFPVMTFVLHLTPKVGRDFSLGIQTSGMSMALFCILFMRIQIEWRTIAFGTAGAVPGALIGLHFVGLWSRVWRVYPHPFQLDVLRVSNR